MYTQQSVINIYWVSDNNNDIYVLLLFKERILERKKKNGDKI